MNEHKFPASPVHPQIDTARSTRTSRKHLRPTGEKLSAYRNHEKWSNLRWAWEFLRRNPAFQVECEKCDAMEEEERALQERRTAKTFHLKKFKHWEERYQTEKPEFLKVSMWRHVPEGEPRRNIQTSISPEQVLFRFNLAPALFTKRALQAQLKYAEKILNKRLNELAPRKAEESDFYPSAQY